MSNTEQNRAPRLWVDPEDPADAVAGDYYCDIMGSWRLDPDGTWRSYYQLSTEELAELRSLSVPRK